MASPQILYAAVFRGETTMVAEYNSKTGNFSSQARRVVPKLLAKTQKKMRVSYSSEHYLFHIVVRDDTTILCIADEAYKQLLAFKFLDKVEASYFAASNPSNSAVAQTLRTEVDFFNSPQADRLENLKKEIDAVKNVMTENIEQLLARGEKIDLLVDRTATLADDSDNFFSSSRTLRHKMWMKNVKMIALIVFVILLIIFIIVLIACGGFKFEKC